MEDEEARKKKQKSYWDWFCGVFWLIAIPVAAIIAGGILLSIGVGQKNRLEGINAQEDFIMLKELCPVTDFAYTGRKQETGDKGKKTGCLDKYIYTFNADQLSSEDEFYGGRDNYLFRSFEHFQRRECQDCNRCDVLPPKFTAGEETECWRPAVPDIKSPEGQLNTWYRCGNDDCIKMFPPQDDEDRGRLISKSLWLAGVITLSVGGPLLVICVIILIFCCEKPTGPSPYKTGTPYQPHSAPNDLHLQPEEKKDTFYDSTPLLPHHHLMI